MRSEMASSRGISLKPAVLAKLMILEHFYKESYKQLAASQAEQAGNPKEIDFAEKALISRQDPVSNDEDGSAASVESKAEDAHEVPEWLSDPAIREWLASEPSLAGEDLRPYFYFSRETLAPMASTSQRMSPLAQEILAGLFHSSQAQKRNALKRGADLSPGDLSALFQTIAERIRVEDDLGKDDSPLWRLMDLVNTRKDLLGQFMTLLSDLPESTLPVSLPPRVKIMGKTDEEKAQTTRLLEKWEKSTVDGPLKTAARSVLSREGKRS